MRWWIWFRGWLKNQKQMEALPEKKAEEQKSFFLYMRMDSGNTDQNAKRTGNSPEEAGTGSDR